MSQIKSFALFLFLLASLQVFAQPQYLTCGSYEFSPSTPVHTTGGFYYRCSAVTGGNGFTETSIGKYNAAGGTVWYKTFTNTNVGSYSYIRNIALDNDGNILIYGFYQKQVDLDPGVGIVTFQPTNSPQNGIFIVKLTPAGTLVWAKSINSDRSQQPVKLRLDGGNNIYIAFNTSGRIDCDPGPDSTVVGANTQYNRKDIVLAKYTPDGNLIFAGEMGSTNNSNDDIQEMLIYNGYIYVGGSYVNPTDFDLKQGVTSRTAQSLDFFIAKYNLNLDLIWVKTTGGANVDGLMHMVVQDSCIYASGFFRSAVDFDFGPNAYTVTANSTNYNNLFVCKYDTSANFIWMRQFLPYYSQLYDKGLAVDSSGNVIMGGYYEDSVRVNVNGQMHSAVTNGALDVFLSVFKPNGDFTWISTLGSTDDDYLNTVEIDTFDDKLHITGTYSGTVDFDFSQQQHTLTATPPHSAYVAVYNTNPTVYKADILTFSIPEQTAPAVIDTATQTITVLVSSTANASALTPVFTLSPMATSSPNSGTTQDFGMTFTYVVTSYDSLVVKQWDVNVVQESDTFLYDADILTFTFPQQIAPAIIDPWFLTVDIAVAPGTDVSQLTPTFTLSPLATSNPLSGVTQDFTNPFGYTVTSFDGLINNWQVNVSIGTDVNLQTAQKITLFPNPTNGLLTINTDGATGLIAELCDLSGRVLQQQQVSNTTPMDISHLAKGMYFCRFLSNGKYLGTKKIVLN